MIASLRMNIPSLAASFKPPAFPVRQTRRLEALWFLLGSTDGGGADDVWGKRLTVDGRVVAS